MNKDGFIILVCAIVSFCFGFLIAFEIFVDCKPSAIDVYQGNTTLEITYRDGVAIDSIVVFKEEK